MYKVLLDYDAELKYIQLPDGTQHYTTANLAEFKHENNQEVEKLVKLKEALQLAFTTFNKYAKYHYAKETDEGVLKGWKNYSIALNMADAINELDKFIDAKNIKKRGRKQ